MPTSEIWQQRGLSSKNNMGEEFPWRDFLLVCVLLVLADRFMVLHAGFYLGLGLLISSTVKGMCLAGLTYVYLETKSEEYLKAICFLAILSIFLTTQILLTSLA